METPPSSADDALRFFARRLHRWFNMAEENLGLTEVMYDGGPTVLDIEGDLVEDEKSDLDDAAIYKLAANAAVYSDGLFSRERPIISVIVPPSWRVTFTRPPIVQRPHMSMRRLLRRPVPLGEYVETRVMSKAQAEELERLVAEHKTMAVSGPVGTGKTTLLRTLLGLVPPKERIITIEDPRELALTEPDGVTPRLHWVALEAVPKVMEMDGLLRGALRMRPDRIIVGEVRGPETLELVRSLNVGHSGSMFTVHAPGGQGVLDRLHTLTVEAQPGYRFQSVENAIDAIVQIAGRGRSRRLADIWLNPKTQNV
jgi:Flp pilus assembly CpaF family ATPase